MLHNVRVQFCKVKQSYRFTNRLVLAHYREYFSFIEPFFVSARAPGNCTLEDAARYPSDDVEMAGCLVEERTIFLAVASELQPLILCLFSFLNLVKARFSVASANTRMIAIVQFFVEVVQIEPFSVERDSSRN